MTDSQATAVGALLTTVNTAMVSFASAATVTAESDPGLQRIESDMRTFSHRLSGLLIRHEIRPEEDRV